MIAVPAGSQEVTVALNFIGERTVFIWITVQVKKKRKGMSLQAGV
jgi:hypothetical protein